MAIREDEVLSAIREQEAAARPDPFQAMQAEREGSPLEADLMRSGFFGPNEEGDLQSDPRTAVLALGDLVYGLRLAGLEERWKQDENVLLNFAMKNGHHYVEVDRARRAVVPLPMPRNHVRRKIPKFAPWYRAQHGKLTQVEPDSRVIPFTRQQVDKDAAEYGETLRKWIIKQAFNFPNRSELTMWQLLGGLAVVHVGIEWTQDESYLLSTDGAAMHRPDLIFEILSPMECWCDNKHPQILNMRWFGRDRFMPLAEARGLYPTEQATEEMLDVDGEPWHARGYWTLRDIQRFLYREDPWLTHRGTAIATRVDEETDVTICEFWGKRGVILSAAFLHGLENVEGLTTEVISRGEDGRSSVVRFPNGIRVVHTPSGKVLEVQDNFLGVLPFKEFPVEQSAGFWTPAWATPLRELNQAFDWAFSLREEHLLRTGNPVMLVPREARMRRRDAVSGTSFRLDYRANRFNVKPEWMNPPSWPSNTVEFLQELENIWQDVSGRHEVSEGKLPAKLSGVAISLLQEQDLSQLGFAGQSLEEGHKETLEMAMAFVQAFFPDNDPRLMALAGDGPYKLQAFMEADLNSGVDVEVVKGSGLPRSSAAIRAEARELWELGGLVDEFGRPDVKRLLVAYQVGSEEALYQEDESDKANSRAMEDLILAMPELIAAQLIIGSIALITPENPVPILPPGLGIESYENALVVERSHRLRLKVIKTDPNISEPNKRLLELRWQSAVFAALPVLSMTEPAVAAKFQAALLEEAAGEGEVAGDEESDAGEGDGEQSAPEGGES